MSENIMAIPKKTGFNYFFHDIDASMDEKIEILEGLFGLDGYAVYFKLLERIYRAGGVLSLSNNEIRKIIQKKCNIRYEKTFLGIINTCCDLGLFDLKRWEASQELTSNGILKRVDALKKMEGKL